MRRISEATIPDSRRLSLEDEWGGSRSCVACEAVRDCICISLAVTVLAHMQPRRLSVSALRPGSKGRASEVWRYEHWANEARQGKAKSTLPTEVPEVQYLRR